MTDPITIAGVAMLSAAGGAFGRTIIEKLFPGKFKVDEAGEFSLEDCYKKHKRVDVRIISLELNQKQHQRILDDWKRDFSQIKNQISIINGNIQLLLERTS